MTTTKKHTWDLSPLYKADTDPQIEKDLEKHKKASYKFINKWKDRTDYLKSAKALKEALADYEAWLDAGGILGEIGYYFSLRGAQNENDPKLKARLNQITDFGTKIENDAQFFTMRLAKIGSSEQQQFLNDKTLTRYHHFLKRLFDDAKYLLSEPEEKILNLKSSPAHSQWVQMTSSLLAKETRQAYDRDGKSKTLTLSSLMGLISHSKPKIRDKAAEAINDILSKLADVAEAEINAILLDKKIDDELRGLPRPDSGRHLSDDIETEVVDALVEAVKAQFNTSQRFYKLKAKLLGKKKLAYHERNVQIGKVNKEYTFTDAAKLIDKVFGLLDPDFQRYFQGFVKNKQIDIFPYQGKSAGAFCAYNNPKSPVYILLNHNNELNDVRTLAHEAGHGINDELMREIQPAIYFGTPMVTAEVASTFTEDFVLEEILREADDELRFSLLMTKLNDDISSGFRQIAAYLFETELHNTFRKEGYLSKEKIGSIFQKNMSAYMGPAVEQSAGAQNWWIYWGHFRNFFYVYSYASGVLISKSLQTSVKKDPKFIEKVKDFLRAGTSDSPKNIFAKLGIDITNKKFWQAGLEEIADTLDEAEKLAKKLGKI
ncbi:MAG: oligoendopeptidase [Patescibacteria group bacterium]|nr:oligoendopeptidase [Patescibacteria group bacterium]